MGRNKLPSALVNSGQLDLLISELQIKEQRQFFAGGDTG